MFTHPAIPIVRLKSRCRRWGHHVLAPLYAFERRRRLRRNSVLIDGEQFMVKIAENDAEMLEAQRLRYRIFIAEQGRQGGAAPAGLDSDAYDDSSLHLLVVEKTGRRVVGTYRVRPGYMARRAGGFYSERQYEIAGIRRISREICEAGRSCVDPEFRNGAVVSLLWAGLIEVLRRLDCRYMIGCASLETTDPAAGWALYEHFRREDLLSARIACAPRPGFELPHGGETAAGVNIKRLLPPLIKGYLRLGAKIGGLPSYDPEFGSIDFPIFFDLEQMDRRYLRHFGG